MSSLECLFNDFPHKGDFRWSHFAKGSNHCTDRISYSV